jgi:hypothetical protein
MNPEFVKALSERVGRELSTRAEAMRAYAEVTGLRDPALTEEFEIASGETVSGDTQVTVDGQLQDDPVDVALHDLEA